MTQTASQPQIEPFTYERPETLDAPKKHFRLARSGLLGVNVQVLRDGGETNLHAHAAEDAAWFVLGGRVRFYKSEEEVAFELGRHEGISIPKGSPYWFESASDEPLEIMRLSARDPNARNQRLNFTPLRERQVGSHDENLVSKEAMAQAKPRTSFAYQSPQFEELPKKTVALSRTDQLSVSVQKIRSGGETNLHSHTGDDEAWFVLAGRARFYGKSPHEVWELGVNQGIFIPQAAPYWFESASDEPLEIMRIGAKDPNVKSERINYENLKPWQEVRGLGGRPPQAGEMI